MNRAIAKSLAVLVLALAAGFGCKPQRVDMTASRTSFEPHDYKEEFELWSREFQILPVDGVENVLTARGTYLSHEFRLAYVSRAAYDFRLSPNEIRDLREHELKASDELHEFFVTVMSGLSKTDDLDPAKNNWEIRLKDERGRQAAPVEIRKIKKPTLAETRYFDFENVERTAYRIFFPLVADDGQPILSESTAAFTLQFSSAMGHGDMIWETKSMPNGK